MMRRFFKRVLKDRVNKLKNIMKVSGIDVAVIRTLLTFVYLTGVKWLRPAIVIPFDGESIVFTAEGEEDGFRELSWIKNHLY